jgi:FtsP/CotA-like multicopper oxidase with cupredoxin domain
MDEKVTSWGMIGGPLRDQVSRRDVMAVSLGIAALLVSGKGARAGMPMDAASPAASDAELTGRTREYFIAADEIDWDYAPSGNDMLTGALLEEEPAAAVFTESGPGRIGRVYRKSCYRAYTDATFATLAPVAPEWTHLGMLGPVIRAEVGDTIVVHFRNNTGFPAGLHPHGVRYDKANEGAPYEDGTSGADRADDGIAPGGEYTYTWEVPERSGPGPADLNSIIWMYHSHTDEVADTYAGLVGPMIITRRGEAAADGTPAGVDREFVTLFTVIDENGSPYLGQNLDEQAGHEDHEDAGPQASIDDDDFFESNLMHSINGYVYGNLPGLTMHVGEHVRWYVVGIGNEVDLHTPHWHGQTLEWMGMRSDMIELLPMSMRTLDMVPDEPGTWLFHCHVNDHLVAGMTALFTVEP